MPLRASYTFQRKNKRVDDKLIEGLNAPQGFIHIPTVRSTVYSLLHWIGAVLMPLRASYTFQPVFCYKDASKAAINVLMPLRASYTFQRVIKVFENHLGILLS